MTWVGIAPPAKILMGIVPGQLGTRSEDVHLSISAVVVAAVVVVVAAVGVVAAVEAAVVAAVVAAAVVVAVVVGKSCPLSCFFHHRWDTRGGADWALIWQPGSLLG